jgi:hypothetical protein
MPYWLTRSVEESVLPKGYHGGPFNAPIAADLPCCDRVSAADNSGVTTKNVVSCMDMALRL